MWHLSQTFEKYQISWKCAQWEPSCSNHAGRRTDMTKLIAACLNFANVPKREVSVCLSVVAKTHQEIETMDWNFTSSFWMIMKWATTKISTIFPRDPGRISMYDICYPCYNWVPVTTAWRVLGLRMEERPPIWGVAVNILNKQSRTADNNNNNNKLISRLRTYHSVCT
jgi:hypothetical protein